MHPHVRGILVVYAVLVFAPAVLAHPEDPHTCTPLCSTYTPPPPCAPSQCGAWVNGVTQLDFPPAAHGAVLRNGWILLLPETFSTTARQIRIWNPISGEVRFTANLPELPGFPYYTSFCSGHALLPDGRLIMVGGSNPPQETVNHAWIFDPQDPGSGLGNGTWTDTCDLCQGTSCQQHCQMTHKRYYPTLLNLPPPYVLVASGWCDPDDDDPRCVEDPVYGGRWYPDRMEVFDGSTFTFQEVQDPGWQGGSAESCPGAKWPCRMAGTYPGLHRTLNGRILFTRTAFGHETPEPGAHAAFFEFFDLDAQSKRGRWREFDKEMNRPDRSEGMSVQLFGRVALPDSQHTWISQALVFGGGRYEPCCDTAECVDTRKSVEWIDTTDLNEGLKWNLLEARMRDPRLHAVAIALPDGQVFVFGGNEVGEPGSSCPNQSAELYDPKHEVFNPAAPLRVPRGYHTVALLLPTGGVMVTSGRDDDGPEDRAIDVYQPPYMYGTRPEISTASPVVSLNSPMVITSPDAASIAKVMFVRPMSYTHHTDTEQRVLQMGFQVNAQGQIVVPIEAGDPVYPGYWMVFLLNNAGKVSTAKFFRIDL